VCRRLNVMHELRAVGAIYASIVALKHPLVLLIGAGCNLGVLAGARVSAFALIPHDGSNKVEESDQGCRAKVSTVT
jgi:hypothetical protein